MDDETKLVLLTYHKIIHSSLHLKIGVLLEFQRIKKKRKKFMPGGTMKEES